MNIKILILGSNGFFGKNLKKLLKIDPSSELLYIERNDIDISNKQQLYEYFNIHNPHIVINCCGIVGSSELNKNNNQFSILNDNLILNINILECCFTFKIKKLIIFSTYRLLNTSNNNNLSNFNEEDIYNNFTFDSNCNNIGYLLSKHIMDMQIQLFQKYCQTSVICLILPNIFGIDDKFCNNGRIIPSLLYKFKIAQKTNTDVSINCNSNNNVNLIYIKDLITILQKCIVNNDINGNILIFNPETNISLIQLTDMIKSITKFPNKIVFNDYDITDNNIIKYDISKFNNFFPNFIFTNLYLSLTEIIDYYNKLD
jgi:nucleoside-diphosphate-sugar epimerase